jgi:hypothetical protein
LIVGVVAVPLLADEVRQPADAVQVPAAVKGDAVVVIKRRPGKHPLGNGAECGVGQGLEVGWFHVGHGGALYGDVLTVSSMSLVLKTAACGAANEPAPERKGPPQAAIPAV